MLLDGVTPGCIRNDIITWKQKWTWLGSGHQDMWDRRDQAISFDNVWFIDIFLMCATCAVNCTASSLTEAAREETPRKVNLKPCLLHDHQETSSRIACTSVNSPFCFRSACRWSYVWIPLRFSIVIKWPTLE